MESGSSPRIEFIPVPELPDYLTADVHREARLHSVSMVVARDDETRGAPCGGVFCTLNGLPGIITARHVWTEIHKAKTLVLMLGPNLVYRVATALLSVYAPETSMVAAPFNSSLPDIAFVPLSQVHRADIEARGKVFYSIDRRRSDPVFDLRTDDGFCIAVGCPDALMRRESRAVSPLTYITNIEKVIERDGWDYLFVNLNLESNAVIPKDLGGMSGGGVWRARFCVNSDRTKYWIENMSRDLILTGITFLQTSLPGRQLIAHGPTSIYDKLKDIVRMDRTT